MSNVSTCQKCLGDFDTSELIWGDVGGMYWVCVSCYGDWVGKAADATEWQRSITGFRMPGQR